jgi:hypothetical protein
MRATKQLKKKKRRKEAKMLSLARRIFSSSRAASCGVRAASSAGPDDILSASERAVPHAASLPPTSAELAAAARQAQEDGAANAHRLQSTQSVNTNNAGVADGAMLKREESRTYKPYSSLPFHLRKPIRVNEYGNQILQNGLFNKGTSFNIGERDRLGLRGLIPSKRLTMQQQIDRANHQLSKEDSDIRKYVYLRDLQDRNETLFHRVLLDNIEELAPIVYTPTVGQACLEFGSSFRRSRGMYFSHYVGFCLCFPCVASTYCIVLVL